MNTGAFVCSCADTCNIDLEEAREAVDDVDVVASSRLLCQDGFSGVEKVIEEHDLDQFVVTCPEKRVQETFTELAEEKGLHPEAASFVDQREGAGWVHEEAAATEKTARLIEGRVAGLREAAVSRTVTDEAGESVAVVGDAETAAALADTADVTLIADGEEFAAADADLDDVTIERGRVVDVGGEFGEFEVALEARVTEDCISCMKCVHEGPDGAVTSRPVDIDPNAERGEWERCCPTDAIEMEGVERTVEFDQVIHPGASKAARGGRIGMYTGPVDAGTIAAVENLLGGVTKPDYLDIDMNVCAAGDSSQQGCNECVEACPHDAVRRESVDSVSFDKAACENCGACTSSCPTGAVQLREPSNERIAREVEALVEPPEGGGWLLGRSDPAIEQQIIAFVCSESAADALREYGRLAASGKEDVEYPPVLPVQVNCTDTVGEGHVMHALATGADGVAIVGCGGHCLHSGPDPKAALVDRLNAATTDLGLGERVTFLAPELGEAKEFAESLERFAGETLSDSPVPAGEHEASGELAGVDRENPEYDSHGWTLESVRAILDHVEPERDVIRGLKDFGRMTVSDGCTLTPTCSGLCPTDAIRRTDGGLQFNHERCVNCGLCEEGCPETAITMTDGLDLSLLPERNADADDPAWTTVLDGEMLECARCGSPFTSKRSAEKIEREVGGLVAGIAPESEKSIFEYCGDCRAKLMFEAGGN